MVGERRFLCSRLGQFLKKVDGGFEGRGCPIFEPGKQTQKEDGCVMKNISIQNSTLTTINYVCKFGETRIDQEILSADSIKFSRTDIK